MNKINFTKPLYRISDDHQFEQTKFQMRIDGTHYEVLFGEKDGKLYVVIGEWEVYEGYRHSSYIKYNIFFRRNFRSSDEGNRVFKALIKACRAEKISTRGKYFPGRYRLRSVDVNKIAEVLRTA